MSRLIDLGNNDYYNELGCYDNSHGQRSSANFESQEDAIVLVAVTRPVNPTNDTPHYTDKYANC